MGKEYHAKLCCSFCGKSQREVKKLVAGPTVYICDECVGLCNDIIAEEIDREETKETQASAEASGLPEPPKPPLLPGMEIWLLAKVSVPGATEAVEVLGSLDELREKLTKS